MPDISVLIVTWNSAGEIKACADSVIKNSAELSAELIIIDNNSDDNSFAIINNIQFTNLKTYRNCENLGFTKAVNQAIRLSSGRNVFLLNPDAVLQNGCMEKLSNFLDTNSNYSACAPLMLNADGTIQYSIRNFPTYPALFFEFTLLAYIFQNQNYSGNGR